MPFYEYECNNCKFLTEVLQKVSDAPLRKCPSCGRDALKKLISAPIFRLKGSGWYETDFKSDKESKHNLARDREPIGSSDTSKSTAHAAAHGKPAESKPAESKAGESKAAESKSGGATSTESAAPATRGSRRSAPVSRTAAAAKPRAAARSQPKAKAQPAPARRQKR